MADTADTEGFLGRWSRLKREARTEEAPVEAAAPERLDDAPDAVPAEIAIEIPVAPPAEEEEPDLSDLPPLDSLDAGSDYTGFLRRDVPEELRRQALRKAWASDPVIAGFRGFAEYDWDYNAPGYGALRPTDDIARLLDAVLPDEKREEEVVEEVMVADAPAAEEPADASSPDPVPDPDPDPDPAPIGEERIQTPPDAMTIPSPPRGEG
ncbi:DUF3306 domain-containing protein [Azospirillum ramasamyi]|uniref:DUF3306 domain-containing protein n=1 Tax=Azospirillum ramasamyi TaxID=682998 RepID=A0A2U9SDX4_9PROT|nr:DUF3306 domain-containing protein [Azospirillum ramasamyi]AWU97053.1 DUF3306 domain-containing protein [Azospirillum ramasamyi]